MTFSNLSLSEVLDDLGSRFIINVPDEELASIERICFQIEQAHWYYEDFVREENPRLPSFSLKSFCQQYTYCSRSALALLHCPLLHEWAEVHEKAFDDFMKYKFRVPVCGAIVINEELDQVLLVKGWNSRNWTFPRGKINKGEKELKCAVREVMEEVGFDVTPYLVTTNHPPSNASLDVNEPDHMEITIKEQRLRLYIVTGVPTSTHFETRTRKEISQIGWHYLSDLPGFSTKKTHHDSTSSSTKKKNHYYMLVPFMTGLRKWLNKRRKHLRKRPVVDDSEYDTEPPMHRAASPPAAIAAADASLQLKQLLGIGAPRSNSPRDSTATPPPPAAPPAISAHAASMDLKGLLGIGGARAATPAAAADTLPTPPRPVDGGYSSSGTASGRSAHASPIPVPLLPPGIVHPAAADPLEPPYLPHAHVHAHSFAYFPGYAPPPLATPAMSPTPGVLRPSMGVPHAAVLPFRPPSTAAAAAPAPVAAAVAPRVPSPAAIKPLASPVMPRTTAAAAVAPTSTKARGLLELINFGPATAKPVPVGKPSPAVSTVLPDGGAPRSKPAADAAAAHPWLGFQFDRARLVSCFD
ncbi:mRNA-decapping enzyme subunit 2 [Allomyces javanicus]|nr:mRNA-decapping enzyme subunit 2 [Allomyces javanicus]